jgi:PPP family 3-phenylpropionic acid transporter
MAITEPPVIETLTPSRRWRASSIYFFSFAGYAAIAPFFSLYLQSIGFSGTQIGAILSAGPLLGLFATPFWSGLADATRKHRIILMGGIGVIVVVNSLIPFLRAFSLVLGAEIILAFFTSQVFLLQDSATVHMLGKQKDRYGRIRLWGTIGWGLSAPLAGIVLDRYGLVWMFWIYAAVMLVNLFLVRTLEFEQHYGHKSYFENIKPLLVDRSWILFLLIAFLCGVGMAGHGNYLSLLFKELGGNRVLGIVLPLPTIVGIALTVSTIFEVPIMLSSHFFLKRFGNQGLLFMAMAVVGLRNLLYAQVTDPNQILLIQVMHGFTYPAIWLAGVNFVAEKAPTGLNATAQGMFTTVLMGFGTAIGNLLSGVLIDDFGIRGMFNLIGIFTLASLALILPFQRRVFARSAFR